MDSNSTQHDEGDKRPGKLLYGGAAIHEFLVEELGIDTDVYYLKRSGWPIGNNSAGGGGPLLAYRANSAATPTSSHAALLPPEPLAPAAQADRVFFLLIPPTRSGASE